MNYGPHRQRYITFLPRRIIALFFTLLMLTCLHPGAYAQEAAPTSSAHPYQALIDVLENEDSRDQLLTELKRITEGDASTVAPTEESANDTSENANNINLLKDLQVTSRLQTIAQKIKKDVSISWYVLKRLVTNEPIPGAPLESWTPAFVTLVIVILVTWLAKVILRGIGNLGSRRLHDWVKRERQPHPRSGRRARRRRPITSQESGRRLVGTLLAFLVDVLVSVFATLAGYATVIVLSHEDSDLSLFSMLFLTAFIVVEVLKSLARAAFSPKREHLRLHVMTTPTSKYWYRWLCVIFSTTGYTLLVIVPIIQAVLTPAVGRLLGLILMLLVYIYAISVIWNRRLTVRNHLLEIAQKTEAQVLGTFLRVLARLWHWLLITYFTVLFIVSQTEQQEALTFMAYATLKTLVTLLVGALLIGGVSTLTHKRIQLATDWAIAPPSFEARLNTYIPLFLKSLRAIIFLTMALMILDAWQAFNLTAWLASDSGQNTIAMIIHVGIILFIAALSWTILASIIEHRLGSTNVRRRPTEREKTLLLLFRNAAAIGIATMTTLIVLSQIGIDIGPLLAGAGVAGLAIGFGAQKLVQDVITGIFIQLENGMNQNDIVEVAGLFGTVEKVTIRSVVIRTLDGGYHLIPFSAIDKVSNHTRDYGYHYGEYSVSHRENVDEVIHELRAAFQSMLQDREIAAEVLEGIDIPGVTSLNERGFTVRAMIKTRPGSQWMVQRAFNRHVKAHFDAAGIEIPYPQSVIHFGRDKHGEAAPLDLRDVSKLETAFDSQAAPGQTRRPLKRPGDDDAAQAPDPTTP